jgi:hypothetical protein
MVTCPVLYKPMVRAAAGTSRYPYLEPKAAIIDASCTAAAVANANVGAEREPAHAADSLVIDLK